MHIAILLAGHTNKAMPKQFHDYHDMFTALFAHLPMGEFFHFTTLAVVDGVFPEQLDDYDGYLISGSAFGVYDDAPFISQLVNLIHQIHRAKKPLAGICFGHQIIAHALGGHARKWDHGWIIGTKEITLTDPPDWIDSNEKTFHLIHVHQDQVTSLPNGANLIGSTPYCKNAVYMIDDIVFAVQGHPEFNVPYTNALADLLEDHAGTSCVKKARKSFSTPHDGKKVANWILKFFAKHAPAQ